MKPVVTTRSAAKAAKAAYDGLTQEQRCTVLLALGLLAGAAEKQAGIEERPKERDALRLFGSRMYHLGLVMDGDLGW